MVGGYLTTRPWQSMTFARLSWRDIHLDSIPDAERSEDPHLSLGLAGLKSGIHAVW
jgi:hypothetical protein